MSHTDQANYPTDRIDSQVRILRRLLCRPSGHVKPKTERRRAAEGAILYAVGSGRARRLRPHDYLRPKCCGVDSGTASATRNLS
jgi:hypothetical protein